MTLPTSSIWNQKQTAAKLGHSVPWFREHRPRLEQLGFPKKDNALDGWLVVAVEAWINRRAQVDDQLMTEEQIALAAIDAAGRPSLHQ